MRPTFFLVLAMMLFASGTLHAKSPRERSLAFDVDVRTGWVHGDHSGGLALGASPRLRYHVLTLGADFQGATIMFRSMASAGATAGVTLPLGRLRLDALGDFGINAYKGVGNSLLGDDPGAGAVVPYAGGRTALLICVSCNPAGHSAWLGLAVSYAQDLYTESRTYTFVERDDNFLGEGLDQEVTRTVTIGQSRFSAFVTAAFTIPL